MKDLLQRLPEIQDSLERKRVLESCSDIQNLSQVLADYRIKIREDSGKLLRDCYISGAGMIKVKILDTGHSILTLNIFGSNHTAGRIPENIHVHDFQAFSFVTRGKIKEQQFKFSKGTDSETDVYSRFVNVMSDVPQDIQARILVELEEIFIQGTYISISQELQKILQMIGVNIDELIGLHMVFNGEKEVNSSGTVVGEKFYQKGVYRLSKLGNRDINEGDNYFLPDSTGHRIDSSENTTTLFLVDKTYKTMGFPKTKNQELKRGHAKRLPQEQEDYESRGYDDYGIEVEELSGIVHGEINYILN